MTIPESYKVSTIPKEQTYDWLRNKHYAHRIPSITYSFGLYDSIDVLVGVCCFGSPPSPSLCIGICGGGYKDIVLELNRLCIDGNGKNLASYFVSKCFGLLPKPQIIVSYSDTSMGHHGYIYQALNFIYTGLSEERTEWRMIGSNMHSKTICEQYTLEERKGSDKFALIDRPVKHRYVYFLGNKKQVKTMKEALNYQIEPYPKGDNDKYDASYKPSRQGVLI
jgi:hypothetical protein